MAIPKLYSDLADWWQLISPTSDYKDESEEFTDILKGHSVKTILELGAGGGNVAWHLKKHFMLTLTDLSAEMLAQSKKQNPELEHIVGDMRSLRLDKTFDAVFIHDAIGYMTNEADLLKAFETSASHLKKGGVLLVAPDDIAETFKPGTNLECHQAEGREVCYMEWTGKPKPGETSLDYDFIIAMKDEKGELRVEVDRQKAGLFSEKTWLKLLVQAGFKPESAASKYSDSKIFIAIKK